MLKGREDERARTASFYYHPKSVVEVAGARKRAAGRVRRPYPCLRPLWYVSGVFVQQAFRIVTVCRNGRWRVRDVLLGTNEAVRGEGEGKKAGDGGERRRRGGSWGDYCRPHSARDRALHDATPPPCAPSIIGSSRLCTTTRALFSCFIGVSTIALLSFRIQKLPLCGDGQRAYPLDRRPDRPKQRHSQSNNENPLPRALQLSPPTPEQERKPLSDTPLSTHARAAWPRERPVNEVQPCGQSTDHRRDLEVQPQPRCCRQRAIRAAGNSGVPVCARAGRGVSAHVAA